MPCPEGLASDFHDKCDGQGPTLTVIETTGGQRFGGVSATSWASPNPPKPARSQSNQEFLFCLNCAGDPNKVFQLNLTGAHDQEATINDGARGPVFGGRPDLSIATDPSSSDASSSALGYSYRCPVGDYKLETCHTFLAGSRQFTVRDYETFTLRIPTLLSVPHQSLISTWIARAEVKDAAGTEGFVTGTVATRCFSFAESAVGTSNGFAEACGEQVLATANTPRVDCRRCAD